MQSVGYRGRMRWIRVHLTLLASLVAVALLASQATSASTAVASVAAAVLVLAVATGIIVGAVGRRTMTVGSRARAHREPLSFEPAPAHPRTAGRTRSRAPSVGVLAA